MFNFGYANRSYPYEFFESEEYRRESASDPNTDRDTLFHLAYSADQTVWDLLMDNPSSSPEVVFVLMYGDDTLFENPRSLSLEQMEHLFYLMDGFAYDLAHDEDGFREKWGDTAVECVEVFCDEEGVSYNDDEE